MLYYSVCCSSGRVSPVSVDTATNRGPDADDQPDNNLSGNKDASLNRSDPEPYTRLCINAFTHTHTRVRNGQGHTQGTHTHSAAVGPLGEKGGERERNNSPTVQSRQYTEGRTGKLHWMTGRESLGRSVCAFEIEGKINMT